MIIREHLRRLGAQSVEAPDGISALTALHDAHQQGEPFHLAILDSHMPDMSGLILAQAIRQRPDCVVLPLILYTSEVRTDHSLEMRALGMAGYLHKPISRKRLLQTVAAVLGQTPVPSKEPVQTQSILPLPAVRILLADDLEDNREVVALFLKETPCVLDMAENGAVAVDKFHTGTYDLILMDIQMPVMDGYNATRAIRNWEQERQRPPIPILALTANAFQDELDQSLSAGCTAHLTKPIKKKTLLAAIAQYAGIVRDRAA
jgi:CheY-like chemotaxis protein